MVMAKCYKVKKPLEILEESDQDKIHDTAMKVLNEVGIKMDHPEVLKLFKANGCEVDEAKKVVKIPESLIKEELNVKSVVFRENEEELVEYRAKPNFRVLGKRLGKDMKAAAARIAGLSAQEIRALLSGMTLSLDLDGRRLELEPEGVEIERLEKEHLKVINEGSLTVALDPQLTQELVDEGIVRDLVRGIQQLRKEMGLDVTDRIELAVHGSEALQKAVERFQDHLKAETLAVAWSWRAVDAAKEIECGEETCSVSVRKASMR